MRLLFGLAAQLVLLGAAPVFRLPDAAKPLRYHLDLTIDPRQHDFHGSVRIEAELRSRTRLIWVNAKDLSIDSASVLTPQRIAARAVVEEEFLGLELGEDVGPGRAVLDIAFHGSMPSNRNSGLYRKSAGNDWYAFTTFTPIDARRAFPCFDEPGYKAPWRVVLHVPRDNVAASNAPLASEHEEPAGLKRVEFAETQPLPSEVVAIAVGPFDVIDAGVAGRNRVPVRVLTPKGRAAEAAGARAATADVLARLEDYTGVPYPWAKLDHVAVLDMPFGAVENPGLITYRDRGLLAKGDADTPEWRFRMRGTMAHELAHQWFGNLVTQAWWDDVWLSEGFATWLGGKISDLERPDFERGLAQVAARIQIMRSDASRPVRLDMNSRKETEGVYSGIVYQKGAAVLYMLEHWVGAARFREGIRAYLHAHANANATTSDFAAAVSAAASMNIAPVLRSFLDRPGFPVLRFACRENHAVVNGSPGWSVPVCVRERGCAIVSEQPAELPGACGDPFTPAGYFVLDRGDEAVLKPRWEQWPAPDRLSFVNDISVLAARNELNAETLRRALPAMTRDPEAVVANAGYRLLITLAAAAHGPDRAKWDAVLLSVSSQQRRH
jgi:alanyl aminopeptidase